MSYDFLELTNAVLRRFNEVTLSASNFSTAIGFYSQVRDAVNSAIQDISSEDVEWPFLQATQTETLVPGSTRYAFPSDLKDMDEESFRLRASIPLENPSRTLTYISYDHYLQQYGNQEDQSAEDGSSPQLVFVGKDSTWGVVPIPDKAYMITFEYYKAPTELSAYGDVPLIPETFKNVIIDGAMYHSNLFRENGEAADRYEKRFRDGVKDMRKILMNRNDSMRPSITFGNPNRW